MFQLRPSDFANMSSTFQGRDVTSKSVTCKGETDAEATCLSPMIRKSGSSWVDPPEQWQRAYKPLVIREHEV
jgi:hypothetical protein